MRQHADEFGLSAMCRMLGVHRGGYYAWLKEPASARDKDDQRLLGLIKSRWLESGSVCGHRKLTKDLRELGERCRLDGEPKAAGHRRLRSATTPIERPCRISRGERSGSRSQGQ